MVDILSFIFNVFTGYVAILNRYFFTQAIMFLGIFAIVVGIIAFVIKGGKK